MDYKISDSEWKVMEILWEKGTATQSEVMGCPDGGVEQKHGVYLSEPSGA